MSFGFLDAGSSLFPHFADPHLIGIADVTPKLAVSMDSAARSAPLSLMFHWVGLVTCPLLTYHRQRVWSVVPLRPIKSTSGGGGVS